MQEDPALSAIHIRQAATDESFRRGVEYQSAGAVLKLKRLKKQEGSEIVAEVEGSVAQPYLVTVALSANGVRSASCSCPYDFGGWCKHIVAALLEYIEDPRPAVEQASMRDSLERLDAPQLRRLLLELSERYPTIDTWLQRRLAGQGSKEPPGAERSARPYAREVRRVIASLNRMKPSEAYWHVGAAVEELRNLVDEAYARLEENDAPAAVAVLDAITEAYLDAWEELDDSNGEASTFFEDLFAVWVEVLLSLDDAADWLDRIEEWAESLDHDYGIGDGFVAAARAAASGWSDPALQAVLRGELRVLKPGPTAMRAEPDMVTNARLRVLAREQRFEEYVRLADTFGHVEACCRMLIQLGRVEEAKQHALRRLVHAEGALSLATEFAEHGHTAVAIAVAEHGLGLPGAKDGLGQWLHTEGLRQGKPDLALRGAMAAFKDSPSLAGYLDVEAAAGDAWEDVRGDLLELLVTTDTGKETGAIEVLLHEAMFDEAIERIRDREDWDYRVTNMVAEAAVERRPEWVEGIGRRQAESIMNAGRADLYAAAARWLALVKRAMAASGRDRAWQEYIASLMAQHRRKYKLLPMLLALAR